MELGGFLSGALGIVSLATLAGLGLLRGTVTNLREQLKDAREEIADKDRRHHEETAENTRRVTEAEKTIARQAADIDALNRVVTGEVHWLALGEQLDEHHRQASEHWAQDEALLTEIRDTIRGEA